MSQEHIFRCEHCNGWVDIHEDHYTTGLVGHVNRRRVYLHGDWCAEVYEASHPLAEQEERNRRRK